MGQTISRDVQNIGFVLGQVYAYALYSLAEQNHISDEVKTDLDVLITVAGREKDFLQFLASPYFRLAYKKELIQGVFSGQLSELTMNFLMVVLDNDRARFLPYISDKYNKIWFSSYGCRMVSVTVSEQLSDEKTKKLSGDIASSMHSNVELAVKVDPSILGGAIIRYGDNVIDNSVRGRLFRVVKETIKQAMERGRFDEV